MFSKGFIGFLIVMWLITIISLGIVIALFSGTKRRKNIIINYCSKDPVLHQDLNKMFAYSYASCFDICSAEKEKITIKPGSSATICTGLIFCLPFDLELQIRPKSGMSTKMYVTAWGTVDADYRGEVKVTLYNLSDKDYIINYGDKIAQGHIGQKVFMPNNGDKFMIVPNPDHFPSELAITERGKNGFGSSGK